MIGGAVILVNVILFFGLLYLAKKRYDGAKSKRDENLARLEEVIRSAELTNGGFFRSLELVQNNLQSLLARAEEAERRLRSLMLQPGSDKKDQYTAAALLLGEGQEPERVASVLKLPLPQVKTVQDLRKMAREERSPTARKRRNEEPETHPQKKNAASREKDAARTTSLGSAGKKVPTANGLGHHPSRHVGVSA
jgi:hypothetical protein